MFPPCHHFLCWGGPGAIGAMAGLKTATGESIDGSFELQVEVEGASGGPENAPDPPTAKGGPSSGPPPATVTLSLRVTGDLHVGGLMLRVVETVGVKRDWSDHALWWEQRCQWLLRPGRTLDALGVGADARLRFAPQHRPLRLRLPNRRRLRLRLSFAQPVCSVVAEACRLLGIRYPEELSLLRPPEEEEEEEGGGKKGSGGPPPGGVDFDLSSVVLPPGQDGPWREPPPHLLPPPGAPPGTPSCYWMLVAPRGGLGPCAPPRPPRGNPLLHRTRLNSRWLVSSRSLMQQGVGDDEELLLRFKYYCFMDIDPQVDAVRAALLYEQARWSLLLEEVDCTEEEMMLFAALQYHIDELGGSEGPGEPQGGETPVDDLEAALSNLEVTLGGGPTGDTPAPLEDLPAIPELSEELEIYRPRRLALRGFRPHWAVLSGTSLAWYKAGGRGRGEPLQQLNLRGCEVTPDVDMGAQKFCIRLLVAAPDGMSEVQLRCRDAPQYARWLAGCRLAACGRSLATAASGAEARGVLGVLGLRPGGGTDTDTPTATTNAAPPPDPRLLLAPRFQRKFKAKQLVPRILDAHQRVAALGGAEARLRFLQAWRALPGFGLACFVVRFQGSRRDEVLAIGPTRLLRMEPGTAAISRSWRYSALRQWNVNWDSRQVALEFEEHLNVAFSVVSASCQTVHEYLGGYVCLGGRTPGQPLDMELLDRKSVV